MDPLHCFCKKSKRLLFFGGFVSRDHFFKKSIFMISKTYENGWEMVGVYPTYVLQNQKWVLLDTLDPQKQKYIPQIPGMFPSRDGQATPRAEFLQVRVRGALKC